VLGWGRRIKVSVTWVNAYFKGGLYFVKMVSSRFFLLSLFFKKEKDIRVGFERLEHLMSWAELPFERAEFLHAMSKICFIMV
jgi:hypothetical protein